MEDERPRLEPSPVCSSSTAKKLAAYYAKHGETIHVEEVERSATDEWQPTDEILAAAGKSKTWGRDCLEYLAFVGKLERGIQPMPDVILYGKLCNWRYVWRRPQASPGEPVLSPE